MDTMNYYAKLDANLQDIERSAEMKGYKTHWVPAHYFGKPRLNIHFGDEKGQWWQWYIMNLDEMWFDFEAERNHVRLLEPASIFLFEYYQTSLGEIVDFLRVVMKQYGGWIDCKGDAKTLYTLDTLHNIKENCS